MININASYCSDVRIKLANRIVPGHRFILTARGDQWLSTSQNWDNISELGFLNYYLLLSFKI